MSLFLSIEGAEQASPRIWRASLQPSFLRGLGPTAPTIGGTSVLLVEGQPEYEPALARLRFPMGGVRILNVGSSSSAVILVDAAPPDEKAERVTAEPPDGGHDFDFFRSVPDSLRPVARALIAGVRAHLPGRLVLREPSGRYVETPANFWTIKAQPRAGTFRVTLRGRPTSFSRPATLQLKDDRPGYSTFVFGEQRQVADAIRLILEAASH